MAEIKKPSKEQFNIAKCKLLKGGGLSASYTLTEHQGDTTLVNDYNVSVLRLPHKDLNSCFNRLQPIMANILGLTNFITLISTEEFEATEKQEHMAHQWAREAQGNIEIKGVSFSGQGENLGVIITGLLTTAENMKTCINLPRIKLATEIFGFEEELEQIVGELENEVYEYLFNDKQTKFEQLMIFDAIAEAENKDNQPKELTEDEKKIDELGELF